VACAHLVHLIVCALVFAFLIIAEKISGVPTSKKFLGACKIISLIKWNRLFSAIPMRYVSLAIPTLFVLIGFAASQVPRDLGVVSALLAAILLLYLTLRRVKDTYSVQEAFQSVWTARAVG